MYTFGLLVFPDHTIVAYTEQNAYTNVRDI